MGLFSFFVLDGTLVLYGFFSLTLKEICDSLSMTTPVLVTVQNSRDHYPSFRSRCRCSSPCTMIPFKVSLKEEISQDITRWLF
jgi:hypothetical protein